MDALEHKLMELGVEYSEIGIWKYFIFSPYGQNQGWKIHVSSQLKDGLEILDIVGKFLIEERCNFKVTANLDVFKRISSPRETTALANKFITIYPSDDNQSKAIILKLTDLLKRFQAPRIMSDFQCGRYSPVHYRYGGYKRIARYDKIKKEIVYLIEDFHGNLVEDRRLNYPVLPDGITDLFTKEEKEKYFLPDKEIPADSPLNNYKFEAILKKSNRGNVYRAISKTSGEKVIVKQVHPFLSDDMTGQRTAISELENESRMLQLFNSMSYTADYIEDFYEAGDYFVVQTYLSGLSFSEFSDISVDSKVLGEQLVDNLVSIVNDINGLGYYLLDLSPNNLIYLETGKIYLIDLENIVDNNAKRRVETPFMVNPDKKKESNLFQQGCFSLCMTSFAILTGNVLKFGSGDEKWSISASDKVRQALSIAQKNGLITVKEFYWLVYILDMSDGLVTDACIPFLKDFVFNNMVLAENIEISSDVLQKEAIQLSLYLGKKSIEKKGRLLESTEFGEFVSPLSFQHGLAGQIYFILHTINKNELSFICDWVDSSLSYVRHKTFEYGETLLFGKAGFLWSLLDVYQKTDDKKLYNTLRELSTDLVLSFSTEETDLVLGQSGILLSLMKYHTLFPELELEVFIKQNIDLLVSELENRVVYTGNIMLYSFAHGYSGVAYTLFIYSRLFGDNWYESLLDKFSEEIVHILEDKISISTNRDIADIDLMGNLELSWCEGVSGLILYLCLVDSEKHQSIIRRTQKLVAKQYLKMTGSYCHGLASLLQTLYYVKDSTLESEIRRLFITYSYRKDGILLFQADNPLKDSFDFGTGTLGIYWTLLNKPFIFDLLKG